MVSVIIKCEIDFRRFWHLPSNGANCNSCTPGLCPTFGGNIFAIFITLKRLELAGKCVGDCCRISHLPWNGVIEKIPLRDLDLLFESEKFKFYIFEMVSVSSEIVGDICRF